MRSGGLPSPIWSSSATRRGARIRHSDLLGHSAGRSSTSRDASRSTAPSRSDGGRPSESGPKIVRAASRPSRTPLSASPAGGVPPPPREELAPRAHRHALEPAPRRWWTRRPEGFTPTPKGGSRSPRSRTRATTSVRHLRETPRQKALAGESTRSRSELCSSSTTSTSRRVSTRRHLAAKAIFLATRRRVGGPARQAHVVAVDNRERPLPPRAGRWGKRWGGKGEVGGQDENPPTPPHPTCFPRGRTRPTPPSPRSPRPTRVVLFFCPPPHLASPSRSGSFPHPSPVECAGPITATVLCLPSLPRRTGAVPFLSPPLRVRRCRAAVLEARRRRRLSPAGLALRGDRPDGCSLRDGERRRPGIPAGVSARSPVACSRRPSPDSPRLEGLASP